MQNADQREQATRSIEIDLDLALQPLAQEFGGIIVDGTTGHVDGLDLLWGGGPYRLIVTIANREVILDRPAEAAERQHQRLEMAVVLAMNVDAEPSLRRFKLDPVGARIIVGMRTLRRKVVPLQQVENRDPPFLIDVGRSPADAVLVQGDVDDPWVGHMVR